MDLLTYLLTYLLTLPIARLKAVVDFPFVIIELFRYLLRLRRYKRKSVEVGVLVRGRSLWAQLSDRRGIAHWPLLVSENYSDYPFMWYQNIRSALFGFVTKHACDRRTDGQTDRQRIRRRCDEDTILFHCNIKQYKLRSVITKHQSIITDILLLFWSYIVWSFVSSELQDAACIGY